MSDLTLSKEEIKKLYLEPACIDLAKRALMGEPLTEFEQSLIRQTDAYKYGDIMFSSVKPE